ncbi:3-isopropylmalate dehydratase small subunit [Kibdelosporangium lantanae]
MRAVSEHTGTTVVLRRGDVDTDQIIPAEYCKRLVKSGYDDVLFANWRADPGFVLNQPAAEAATILVAGHNFGTGSSREHAVWALRDWGFVAVVASSFGDIFRRNAWKNGLMAVEIPAGVLAELTDLAEADPGLPVTVDLVARELRAGPVRHGFPVDDQARMLLLNGLDDIGLTLAKDVDIRAYEQARPHWLPTVAAG